MMAATTTTMKSDRWQAHAHLIVSTMLEAYVLLQASCIIEICRPSNKRLLSRPDKAYKIHFVPSVHCRHLAISKVNKT